MTTMADERASIARVSVVKYGAIPDASASTSAGVRTVSRRSGRARALFGALLAACVAVLGFCQFFTDVTPFAAIKLAVPTSNTIRIFGCCPALNAAIPALRVSE